MKLSATVITFNEEEDLPRCLASLKSLVDEIVVIDSGSSDQTLRIAKEYGAKVTHRKFTNFAEQKNYASDQATGDWILSVDGDEEITADLGKEIRRAIESREYDGYLIGRRNYILGGEIKHSWWSPDQHIWLWRKGYGRWQGDVHEEVEVKGEVGTLRQAKLHYQDKTVAEFMAKNNRYSSLEAERLYRAGSRFSWWRMVYQVKFEFFMRYFFKQGYLDGWRGLVLACLMSIYKCLVWLKILELQKGAGR